MFRYIHTCSVTYIHVPLHTYMFRYIHTCSVTYIHVPITCIRTYTYIYIYVYICVYIYIYIYIYIYTSIHPYIHTYTHTEMVCSSYQYAITPTTHIRTYTHTHTYIHTYPHTHIHRRGMFLVSVCNNSNQTHTRAHTHTHTHTYIHTYMHTHTQEGYVPRIGMQYHWNNSNHKGEKFTSFDDFLSDMKHGR
jgi:hypothetical protein